MRVAVVFSGVPRWLRASSERFQECLQHDSRVEVDYFSYVWRLDEWRDVADAYPHADLGIQDTWEYESFPPQRHNIYAHWYGVQRAAQRFQWWCKRKGARYDLVVRTRHDIWLHQPIDFFSITPSVYNIADNHWQDRGLEVFDDNLCITNPDLYLRFYNGFFEWYMNRPESREDDVSEEMLSLYARTHGMGSFLKRNPALNFTLTRGVVR